MNVSEGLAKIQELLSTEVFELSGTRVTLATVLSVLVIVILTFWGSRLLRRGLEIWFRRRGVKADGTVHAVGRLVHYLVVFVGFGAALQTIGINLSALFAAGAIFAVGLGFAMQNIAQNFVSGVILLAERAIKRGDILRVDGELVRVTALGIRSTIVQTRDGLELIVPNSAIVQSTVTNYTLGDSTYRIRITVGVVYRSDMKVVRETLESVANELTEKWDVGKRDQQIVLVDFGNHSVDWQIAMWTSDPWRERFMVSELREAVWWAFKERGIVIAFPQVDVHFDPPVEKGLARLAPVGS